MLLKRRRYNTLCYLTMGLRVHRNATPIGNAFWVRVKTFMPLPRVPPGCGPKWGCSQHTCPWPKSLLQNLHHHCHGPWGRRVGKKEGRFGNIHPQTRPRGVWVPVAHTNQLQGWSYIRLFSVAGFSALELLVNQNIPPSLNGKTASAMLSPSVLLIPFYSMQTLAEEIWVLGRYL